jgi:hypothetical protein
MARVASKGVVISLPDAALRWPFAISVPRVGIKWFSIPRPRLHLAEHRFDGEHYWEINKAGYPLSRLLNDFQQEGQLKLLRTFRVAENPYHRFFSFAINKKNIMDTKLKY